MAVVVPYSEEITNSFNSWKANPRPVILSGPKGLGMDDVAISMAEAVIDNKIDYCEIHLSDGKQSIGVDEILPALNLAKVTPEGEYAVCIIFNFDRLTVQAQNKLLKTIEEGEKTIIIGVSDRCLDNILKTVKSRMQLIQFSPLDKESFLQCCINNCMPANPIYYSATKGCPALVPEIRCIENILGDVRQSFIEGDEVKFLEALGNLKEKDKENFVEKHKDKLPILFNVLEDAIMDKEMQIDERLELLKLIAKERNIVNSFSYSKTDFFTFLISLF